LSGVQFTHEGMMREQRVGVGLLVLIALCTAGRPQRSAALWPRAPHPVLSGRLRLRGGADDAAHPRWSALGLSPLPAAGAEAEEQAQARSRGAAHSWAAHGRGNSDWDIEDPAKIDSEDDATEDSEDDDEGSSLAEGFLTPADLHELEAPIRRKAVRNPEGYYVYNRTADRWEKGKWDPVALPGEDQFHATPANQEHPLTRTARRANETLEEFVRRCPCWPPYCRGCPLRQKASLSTSALLLHERITGSTVNVTTALRCGLEPPFSPALAQDLGGFSVPRSQQEDLDALLRVAVEDNDVAGAATLLKAGANVSEVGGCGCGCGCVGVRLCVCWGGSVLQSECMSGHAHAVCVHSRPCSFLPRTCIHQRMLVRERVQVQTLLTIGIGPCPFTHTSRTPNSHPPPPSHSILTPPPPPHLTPHR